MAPCIACELPHPSLHPSAIQVWEKDEPEAATEAEDEAAGSSANGGAPGTRDAMEVVVSDVTDANGLYVQVG